MKTKMNGNNKGFSLVELIVVMAIMAILAVTMAPRLGHYIEKARKASDRETVNTVYTAVKYALADEELYNVAKTGTVATDPTAGLGTGESRLFDYTSASSLNVIDKMYAHATGSKTCTIASVPAGKTDRFFDELKTVIGNNITFKSNDFGDSSKLLLTIIDQNTFFVTLDYDGSDATLNDRITINSAD